MKFGSKVVVLLFGLAGIPLGRANELKALVPPPETGNLRGLQDTNATDVANSTIPNDANGTLAEGMGSSSSSSGDDGGRSSACCAGKPNELSFLLTGGSCTDSTNPQGGKFSCRGPKPTAPAVVVKLISGARFVGDGPKYRRTIAADDTFAIEPTGAKFQADTPIRVGKQRLKIHTSCSKPLDVGDIFGSLTLVDYLPRPLECAFCVNDAIGGDQDTGCSAHEPLCDGEKDEAGETCSLCINDKPRGLKDSGCNDECKTCAAPSGEFGDECKVCQNDRRFGGQDAGCPIESPLCIAGFGSYGDGCAVCINDNDNDEPDSGCTSPGRPECKARKNRFGFECLVCRATPDRNDNDIDPGCNANQPFCDGDAHGGSGCFKCRNDQMSGQDLGCNDPDFPECVAAQGGWGTECAFCVNDIGDEIDSGCKDASPYCVADFHEGGSFCAPCFNDKADPNIPDTGCDTANPLCLADLGEAGSECLPCEYRKVHLDDDAEFDTYSNSAPEGCVPTPIADMEELIAAMDASDMDECYVGIQTMTPGESTDGWFNIANPDSLVPSDSSFWNTNEPNNDPNTPSAQFYATIGRPADKKLRDVRGIPADKIMCGIYKCCGTSPQLGAPTP